MTDITDYKFGENEKIPVIIALLGSIIGFIPPLVIYLLQKDSCRRLLTFISAKC